MLPAQHLWRATRLTQRCVRSIRWSSINPDVSNSPSRSPKIIFSGIQPTGIPHLGNYLGALQPWVKLQNESPDGTRLIFSIVDLHAITVSQDPKHLRNSKWQMLASMIAVGLDPAKCTLFFQSDVPSHSELMWILSCQASNGSLFRMTQWKSKLGLSADAKEPDKESMALPKLGLFSYPVLQAADVLIHRATHVPVGHDQAQHLEFARECATRFNHAYGDVLVPPETLLSPAKRVMALDKPTLKMSKSHQNENSRILLTDNEEVITKKLKSALTDSENVVEYDQSRKPGVSNLLDIIFHLEPSGAKSAADLATDFKGLSYKVLKEKAATVVSTHLQPVRERYQLIMEKDEDELVRIAKAGAEKANDNAKTTLSLVHEAIGF